MATDEVVEDVLPLARLQQVGHHRGVEVERIEPDGREPVGELLGPMHHERWPVGLDSLDLDTAVMAYLLEPGEGKYVLDDLVGRHLGLEVRSPDVAEGTLDLDGDASIEETGRRAHAVLALGA